MTPETISTLHTRAFAGSGRAWSAQEFEALLQSKNVFIVGDDRAFALVRAVADEAEILTLATDPTYRRGGLARSVLAQLEAHVVTFEVERVFLEVAENNVAARALYTSAGYSQISKRPDYYKREDGTRLAGLILEKPIFRA